jgi:integrase
VTDGAAVVDLPYCKPEKDRQGRIAYWYFRRHGRRWRLPGEPLSEAWLTEYSRLKAETDAAAQPATERQAYPPKSFGALVLDYYASPEFRDRKPNTQTMYRRIIDPLVARIGNHAVALIERRHVKKWRDEKAETPGMANMVVRVVSLLMSYAIENDGRKDNPAAKVRQFQLGEHRAWTPEELAAYERRWPQGTMQRRAYALARYTGQRLGDVAGMTRAHRSGGRIRVRQQKTGTDLEIAEHRELTAELARGKQHISLLVSVTGKSYSPELLGDDFSDWIDDAGLPDDCVPHGLRKVAARDLADAGCSAHEIMSITGHKSLKEVERYTKAADQRRLGDAAILKLERNGNRTAIGKRPRSKSGKQKPSVDIID